MPRYVLSTPNSVFNKSYIRQGKVDYFPCGITESFSSVTPDKYLGDLTNDTVTLNTE